MKKYLYALLYLTVGVMVAVFVCYLNAIVLSVWRYLIEGIIYFFAGALLRTNKRIYKGAFALPIFIILLFFGIIYNEASGWTKLERCLEMVFIGGSFFVLPYSFSHKKYILSASVVALQSLFILKISPELQYKLLKSMEVNNDNLEKSDISTLMYQAEFLNIDSLPVSIPKSYLKDKNLLIDFWYIKCSPCLRKMVPLAAVKMRIGKTGTGEVILINDGSIDSFSTFKKAVSGLPKNLQYLYDVNGKLTKSVNVTGYPYEIVLHRGEVVRKLVGFNKGETDDLYIDEVLEMLNNKK